MVKPEWSLLYGKNDKLFSSNGRTGWVWNSLSCPSTLKNGDAIQFGDYRNIRFKVENLGSLVAKIRLIMLKEST